MSLFKKTILALFLVALSVGLTACKTVGPDFTSPSAPVADKWNVDDEDGLDHAPVELSEWWTILNDSTLDHLVDLVLNQNITLEMTALRVLESRARLGIATGSRYPQSQVAFGDAAYVSPPESSGISSGDWQYSLGASVAWEADFWGRYRRGIESADAAYLASIATYDQIMVLLAAQVVDSYVVIRENGEQLRIAHENVILQERSYEIAEVLFRNGSTSELDMQQALTLLLSTKATIPALETGIQRARNSMNYLLGRPPGDLPEIADEPSGIPVVPDSIHLGFPTELLRRRPDVREAELLARAQSAQIGLAKADLYPRFTLSGFMGLSAGGPGGSNFGDLFDSDAFGYSFGPSFSWPFLNYGRIKNNVRVQDARLQQTLLNYRDVVLRAAREVEDSIASYSGIREQSSILLESVESAIRSNQLSTLQYREGFTDYQRVLDSQRRLFTEQQRLATNQGNAVRSLIALNRALGSGWEFREESPRISAESLDAMTSRVDWGDLLSEHANDID